MNIVKVSKRLSPVLRHRPQSVGLALGEGGWVEIDDLLTALSAHGLTLTRDQLDHVVATSDKKRFTIDASGTKIRAAQGHSVAVALGYEPSTPPDVLYHGTPTTAVPAILREGLRRQRRHAVHLSVDEATAAIVGSRRGPYAVLRVDAAAMAAAGHLFAVSDNGVWLTEQVPPEFLSPPT